MSLEWNDLNSNTVADLRYACNKYGLKINSKTKKENMVNLLDSYKSKHASAIKRDENAFNNIPESPANDIQKIRNMLHNIPAPKTPTVTPQRKTIWMHTPVQIFNEDQQNHISVKDTPGYKNKVSNFTKKYDDIPVMPKHQISHPLPQTPFITTTQKETILQSPIPKPEKKVTIQVRQSPTINERMITSPRMFRNNNNRKKNHNKVVIISFMFFISLISILLFLYQ